MMASFDTSLTMLSIPSQGVGGHPKQGHQEKQTERYLSSFPRKKRQPDDRELEDGPGQDPARL